MILPSLGLSWAVAAVILQTGRAGSRLFRSGKYPPRLFVYLTIHVLLISWILSLATESYRRLSRSAAERVANAAQGDPSHFPAVLEYALQLAEEGRNAEATTLILNVESAAPWYREIPLVKAEVLLMGGHTQAAAHHVRQVLAKDPGNHRGLRILRAIHRNDAHCVMP